MRQGARTPEELETLFEETFVIRDREALAELFEDGAVLSDGSREARGREQIARRAGDIWDGDRTYLAEPRRILQTRDTALVVSDGSVNVVRRGGDGAWRYAISLLLDDTTAKEEQ